MTRSPITEIGETPHQRTPAPVRYRALLKALGGLVAIILYWPLGVMGLLERLINHPSGSPLWSVGTLLAGLLSAPFVLLCIGLVEALTGRPFRQVSCRWNRMAKWKQGLFSFLLLCLGIGFLGLILCLIVRYFPAGPQGLTGAWPLLLQRDEH
jgi:hypothetical protein